MSMRFLYEGQSCDAVHKFFQNINSIFKSINCAEKLKQEDTDSNDDSVKKTAAQSMVVGQSSCTKVDVQDFTFIRAKHTIYTYIHK